MLDPRSSSSPSAGEPAPVPERWLALLVLVAVVAALAPSLGGTWVWDDRSWGHAPMSIVGALTAPLDALWRPAASLTIALVQTVSPTPLAHRLVSLALHLVAVVAVARAARALGARPAAAWAGAALFGLHPAGSEVVGWIGARTEAVPSLLLMGSWAAFLSGRPVVAGVLAACSPFGKEAFLVAPGSLLIWGWGTGRSPWRAAGIALVGAIAYLVLRTWLLGPLPVGAARADPLGAIGATGLRGLELLLMPGSADAFAPFVPAPRAGLVVLGLTFVGALAARGRPALAAVVAALPPLLPNALAVASTGLVGDRYFYVPLAGLGIAAALGVEALWRRAPRVAPLLVLLPVALGLGTYVRAGDWVDTAHLAAASLRRDPDNGRAAFHYGYALHTEGPGCAAALPWYERGLGADARDATNLFACLVGLGRYEEAIGYSDRLPAGSAPATANLARAYAGVGRPDQALTLAQRAVELDPERASSWVLLGNLQGMKEDLDGAERSFDRALSLAPEDADALAGLRVVGERRAEKRIEVTEGASLRSIP